MSLFGTRLHHWTLPVKQCIANSRSRDQHFIPVSVWQAALPVFLALLANPEYPCDEWYLRLSLLVEQRQPTVFIQAKHCDDGSWEAVDSSSAVGASTEESAVVQRVEVLRDIDWQYMGEEVIAPRAAEMEVQCRLVLRACPFLQHLHLDADAYVKLRHEDTFALLPCLRSVRLTLHPDEYDEYDGLVGEPLFDYRAMLDSLPHFTSLSHTTGDLSSIAELLNILSQTTPEELHVDCTRMWIRWRGCAMTLYEGVEGDDTNDEEQEEASCGDCTHCARIRHNCRQ